MSEGVKMTVLQGTEVAVWFEDGLPTRLVWAGDRYRVTDHPTRLEDEMAGLTHPLDLTGWRFQGTTESRETHMFDVARRASSWELLRVYD